MQLAGGIAVAAAGVAAAIVLSGASAPHHISPVVTPNPRPVHRVTGPPAVKAAPYYLEIDLRSNRVTVDRTSSGAKIASLRLPAHEEFAGVAAAGNDRTFVLAIGTTSATKFAEVTLKANGQPGKLVPTRVPPAPSHVGSCFDALAGLAVSQNGRLLAYSVLADCPTGNAGPAEIVTARLATGHVIAKFRPGDGYPQWLSLTSAGALSYQWSGPRSGIWVIPKATSPGSTPRRLIGPSGGLKGYSGAANPEVTPDGSTVLSTLFQGTSEVIGEFSARSGKGLRLLTKPARDPAQYCGPLWTDASGARLLLACGDAAEFEISNGRLTKLPSPWKLPTYPVPGAPLIAW